MSQQINLFDPDYGQHNKPFAARASAGLLALLGVGAIGMAALAWHDVATLRRDLAQASLQAARRQAQLDDARIRFAPRAPDVALERAARAAEAELAALRQAGAVLAHAQRNAVRGYAEHFRALGRQHRDGLWLTGVAVGGAGGLALQGRALEPALVPAYLARLGSEPVLRGQAFGEVRIRRPAPSLAAGAGTSAAREGAGVAFVEFSLRSGDRGRP